MAAPDPPRAAELRERLLEVIRHGAAAPLSDEEFQPLALDVFQYQFHHNRPYRAYCQSRGATPDRIGHWTEIPAVPTDAFKAAPLVCGDPDTARTVFRTSGTTVGADRRGAHYFPDLALYDASLREGFSAHLLPGGDRLPILSLVPPPEDQPDSSLSHMIGEVVRSYAGPGSGFFMASGGLRLAELIAALAEAERAGRAVLIPGTSFAFVHLLDALRDQGRSFRLPPGSRVMDTGGFKGRAREISRGELYAEIERGLGIPVPFILNEYGMTEMSSQFYDGIAGRAAPVEERVHRGPGWVRTRACDPETLRPVPDGELGVLRHWDLANLGSVMVLQTSDLGRVLPEGLRLHGRAAGAEARGCSIATEELLGALRRSGGS